MLEHIWDLFDPINVVFYEFKFLFLKTQERVKKIWLINSITIMKTSGLGLLQYGSFICMNAKAIHLYRLDYFKNSYQTLTLYLPVYALLFLQSSPHRF